MKRGVLNSNQFAEISRPDKCKVKFLDYDGNEILEAEALATCIQHEMDKEFYLLIIYLN